MKHIRTLVAMAAAIALASAAPAANAIAVPSPAPPTKAEAASIAKIQQDMGTPLKENTAATQIYAKAIPNAPAMGTSAAWSVMGYNDVDMPNMCFTGIAGNEATNDGLHLAVSNSMNALGYHATLAIPISKWIAYEAGAK